MMESVPLKYSVVASPEQLMSSHGRLSTGKRSTGGNFKQRNLIVKKAIGKNVLTTGSFMQIIHKKNESWLFSHGTCSTVAGFLVTLQYSEQVS